MIDQETRRFWLASSARGSPPPPAEYLTIGLNLQAPWHVRESVLPLFSSIKHGSNAKTFAADEWSRGHSKSVSKDTMVLYVAEYILPFLPIRDANRRIYLIGRDENHVLNEIMAGLHETICEEAPWLKVANWEELYEAGGAAAVKNAKPKNFNKSQFDLTNGVSIRGRSINQGIRGAHVYLVIIDDLIDEKSWTKSHEYMALIDGALRPAIEPGGLLLVLGTPQADGDLYDLMANDERYRYNQFPAISPDYVARNEEAIARGWLPPTSITSKEDLQCLWPWRLNHAQLMAERGNTPSSILKFEREYMLRRIADDDSFVRHSDALAMKDPSLHYSRSAMPDEGPYFGGVDPSSLSKDDAAILIGFVDESGNRVPRHIRLVRARGAKAIAATEAATGISPEEQVVNAINESSLAFGNPYIKLEKNGYQGVIKPFAEKVNPTLALSKIHLGANKHTEAGWLAVRTLARNGKIRLPYGPTPTEAAQIAAGLLDESQIEARRITDELIQQLMNLRVVDGKIINANPAIHDDMVSALFLFIKAAESTNSGSTSTSSALPTPLPPRGKGPEFTPPTQSRLARTQILARNRRQR